MAAAPWFSPEFWGCASTEGAQRRLRKARFGHLDLCDGNMLKMMPLREGIRSDDDALLNIDQVR